MGYLTTDGDHDSDQADRVLRNDGRPRGRRALLTVLLLIHSKHHRPPIASPSLRPFLPRGSRPPPTPPPPPRRLSNLGSGRFGRKARLGGRPCATRCLSQAVLGGEGLAQCLRMRGHLAAFGVQAWARKSARSQTAAT